MINQEVAPNIPPIIADASRLEQVLVNLISNSIKFSKPGSEVILTAECKENDFVRISVKDFGMGIQSDDLKNLFAKFYRGKNVMGKNIGGTGLGLCITRSIVEAHGGTIKVNSVVNEGTEIELMLLYDGSVYAGSAKL